VVKHRSIRGLHDRMTFLDRDVFIDSEEGQTISPDTLDQVLQIIKMQTEQIDRLLLRLDSNSGPDRGVVRRVAEEVVDPDAGGGEPRPEIRREVIVDVGDLDSFERSFEGLGEVSIGNRNISEDIEKLKKLRS